MGVILTDGVLGLEATWVFNSFTMNDRAGGPPWTELTQIDNPSGDFVEASTPASGPYGEIPIRARMGGKSLTFTGTMRTGGLQALRALGASFKTASSITDQTQMLVTPHPSWGTVAWTIFGRPIAFASPEKQDRSPWAAGSAYQRDFVLTFHARDPRAFALGLSQTAGAADTVSATITPGGRAPTEPIFTIAGPAGATLVLTHNGTGRKITFTSLPLLAGHNLIADFGGTQERRTFTIDGVDVSGFINWAQTDWLRDDTFGLAPGANSVKSAGAGAWTVGAFPAVFS